MSNVTFKNMEDDGQISMPKVPLKLLRKQSRKKSQNKAQEEDTTMTPCGDESPSKISKKTTRKRTRTRERGKESGETSKAPIFLCEKVERFPGGMISAVSMSESG